MKEIIGLILILLPLASFFVYIWYYAVKIAIEDGEYGFIILNSAVTFIPLGAYLLSIN